MDELAEGLSLVGEINLLIRNLQESLRLFEEGQEEDARRKIVSVEEGIEELRREELPGKLGVEEDLAEALTLLDWVRDRVP